jgi:DNA-binding XRE family transcriptional regulator
MFLISFGYYICVLLYYMSHRKILASRDLGSDTMPEDDDLPLYVGRHMWVGRRKPAPRAAKTDEQKNSRPMFAADEKLEIAAFAIAAREVIGATRKSFAVQLGISPKTLGAIERGEQDSVSMTLVLKMAKAAGRRLKLSLGD